MIPTNLFSKTIVGDFMKEQDKFLSEKKAKVRASEAAVPPWVGYNEEEQMKTQILTLSNVTILLY